MSFLDIDTSDAVEPSCVPGDIEYKVRIIAYREKEDEEGKLNKILINQNGEPYISPIFEIPSEPTSKDFNTYIPLPHDEMDPKTLAKAKWRLEEFKRCFNIPQGRVDLANTIGNEGYVILGLKEDPQYGEQNFIKKMIVPKR